MPETWTNTLGTKAKETRGIKGATDQDQKPGPPNEEPGQGASGNLGGTPGPTHAAPRPETRTNTRGTKDKEPRRTNGGSARRTNTRGTTAEEPLGRQMGSQEDQRTKPMPRTLGKAGGEAAGGPTHEEPMSTKLREKQGCQFFHFFQFHTNYKKYI